MMRRFVMACLSFGMCACPSDDVSPGEEGTSTGEDTTSTTSPSTTASTSSTTATTTSSSSTGSESSDTGPMLGCGNGELEEGEQCDDGNQVDDDACSNDCVPSCGLRWEYLVPRGSAVDLVAPDDRGNVRLTGVVGADKAPMLYRELLDDQGMSLESDMIDVGFVDAPNVPWMAAVGAGEFVFGDQDLGNGPGARVALFEGDGMVAWDVEPDPTVIDEPFDRGVALAPDGDAVVSGAVNVADGDDDIWVAKLSASDGSTVWTGTHSGPLVGGFSTDDGGPIAVAGDGSVYVFGLVRQGLGLTDPTLVKFGPDGGAPEWANAVLVDGGAEDLFASSVAADAEGDVLVGVQTLVGASPTFEIMRFDPDGAMLWTFTTADLARDRELPVDIESIVFPNVAFAADGSITVMFTVDLGVAGTDLFVLRLDGDGAPLCNAYHHVDEIEGDRAPVQFAVMPDGGAVVAGEGAGSDFSTEWVARFRP